MMRGLNVNLKGTKRVLTCCTLCATFLCLALVTVVDHWARAPSKRRQPKQVNDLTSGLSSFQVAGRSHSPNGGDEMFWEDEYAKRVQRVRDVCEKDEIAMMRRIWRVATNRRFGKKADCQTRLCPIIIDEQKVLFFCFIPKVASTRLKQFFLNISDIPINETLERNKTAMNAYANTMLHRISPMYYPSTTLHRFFKIIFVRHPFERLVSAFRTKAEAPRESIQYFYDAYWDQVMKKLRVNQTVDSNSKLKFSEFVWYLIHSLERDYDIHWTPYWSRCDPCLVDYDFVGKAETSARDFQYAFRKVGIESSVDWWANSNSTNLSRSLKYFSQVSEDDIKRLYQIYRLDFELFDYSIDEFLSHKRSVKS